ncbi:zinc dependent phospholipase C family protein [Shouchella patagoniensis]|uniref:zinc dependent phospholipase C family protein n=1 Tax=Shouchella patagoniensis TaxID=228576 RepID=UPI000995301C|nr:zinc dependent phospholipase C family protein [Shouchella patagoniensis]
MGSRIMHAIIAQQLVERLSIKEQAAFLIGGMAPDAGSSKDESHFFIGEHRDYSRSINYKGFLAKYHRKAKDAYILGYFIHLIADDIWLKGFYLPWLKNRMEKQKETGPLYYRDFSLLNGKLLEHYGLKKELKNTFDQISGIIDLEEVTSKDVEAFIPAVIEDMNYDQQVIEEKLKILTFDQMLGYIETSIEIGYEHVKRLEA